MIGHQDRVSGVGEAARRLSVALAKIGYEVDHFSAGFSSAKATNQSSNIRAADLDGYSVVIVAVNPDLLPFVLLRNQQILRKARRIVAFWSWEFESCPQIWAPISRLVDEVWTISSFSAKAISAIAHDTLVRVAPLAIPDEFPSRKPRNQKLVFEYSTGYKFYFNFDFNSDFERKNPHAVIAAFSKAFDKSNSEVRLIIKSINGNLHPRDFKKLRDRWESDSRISFFDEHLSRREMNWLVQNADAFVSLHRSEGYGINLIDALAQRTRLIASAYSGNLDFMSDKNAFLVPGKLIQFKKKYGPYLIESKWFDPSVESAANLMERAFRSDHVFSNESANIVRELILENDLQIRNFGQELYSAEKAQRRIWSAAQRYALCLGLGIALFPAILIGFMLRKLEEFIWLWPAMFSKKQA